MADNTDNQTPPNNQPPKTHDTPPPQTDAEKERLANENANLRKQLKETDGKLTSLADELSGLKKAGHKNSGDWQKVAEQNENEAKTWKEKFEKSNSAFVNTLAGSAVREEALKNGFKPDLVDLLDSMDLPDVEVVIDENNRFNVKGATTAVQNLKKLRPSLFQEATPPKFNSGGGGNGGGGGGGQPTTVKEAQAAYLEARQNRAKNPEAYKKALENLSKVSLESRKAK
jgi:hypothetical protein